jgi:hypothetical protein
MMSRLALSVALVMVTAVSAWAGPGDPVVGTIVAVDRNVVGIRWAGTAADPFHATEGAQLGGFTLFASLSPGGPVIARLQIAWPPPPAPEEEGGGSGGPGFGIFGVPDGRYYVLPVRGLVQSPNVAPPSAWSELVVNMNSCNTPPATPVNLQVAGPLPPHGTVYAQFGWQDGPGGCPPLGWELVAGTSPGASNSATVQVPGRNFQTIPPPGTFYVRVHAYNNAGRSAASNEVVVSSVGGPCINPGIPPGLTASVAGNQVTLNWGAAAPGSRPTTLYHVGVGSQPGLANLANIYLPANQTSLTATAPPGHYYVRVSAGNGCTNTFVTGLPSNEVIVDVH